MRRELTPAIASKIGVSAKELTVQSAEPKISASLIGINVDPASVIAGLAGLDQILEPILDELQANAANQVLALKGFISGAINDLNAVFKDPLDQTFENLSAQEKEALTQAQLLSYTAVSSLEKLESEGFRGG